MYINQMAIMLGAMCDDSVKGNESVTDEQIKRFIHNAGKGLATVYFTDKWAQSSIKCPVDKMNICKANGAVPFIRLQNSEDPDGSPGSAGKYSHSKIIEGKWDKELKKYALDVKAFGTPVMIEYGTEINGDWFCWSVDEPKQKFIDAFRTIVKIFRENGADNAFFALHLDATDNNRGKEWFPGDDVVDWIGTSCYGGYGSGRGCIDSLALCYKDFADISKTANLGVFEWGAPDAKDIKFNIKDTVNTLKGMPTQFPRIKLLQRWAERVIAGHSSDDKIGDGRIDVTPEMQKAYSEGISLPIYKGIFM